MMVVLPKMLKRVIIHTREQDDPTYFCVTIVVAQALCLTFFNLSPAQKTCLFTYGNKASVCEYVQHIGSNLDCAGQPM